MLMAVDYTTRKQSWMSTLWTRSRTGKTTFWTRTRTTLGASGMKLSTKSGSKMPKKQLERIHPIGALPSSAIR